jgi:hypothetical protein
MGCGCGDGILGLGGLGGLGGFGGCGFDRDDCCGRRRGCDFDRFRCRRRDCDDFC